MEKILGIEQDRTRVERTLDLLRNQSLVTLLPKETKIAILISEIPMSLDTDGLLDTELFKTGLTFVEQKLALWHPNIFTLKNRYYLLLDEESPGGFYHKKPQGYRFIQNYGYSYIVGLSGISPTLRTVECLKNYLHDLIHANTFRTIRPFLNGSNLDFYREQYGFNFRRKDGISYSSPPHTPPSVINLGLLMDGITDLLARAILRKLVVRYRIRPLTDQDKVLYNILFKLKPCDKCLHELCQTSKPFHEEVIQPTLQFIKDWWRPGFWDILIHAMLTGDMIELTGFFSSLTGNTQAFKVLFKQPAFGLGESK